MEPLHLSGLSCSLPPQGTSSMDLAAQKSQWRKKILALRENQELHERGHKSRLIIRGLEQDPHYLRAELLLFYASFGAEVATHAAIQRALARGKQVALPVVSGTQLRLSLVRDFHQDLAPGVWGILEPKADRARWLKPQDISLAIVPGVAFDLEKYRLGYGKGYYDRLLQEMPQAYKIGLAYELQVVSQLPRSSCDVGVDGVITESRKIGISFEFNQR